MPKLFSTGVIWLLFLLSVMNDCSSADAFAPTANNKDLRIIQNWTNDNKGKSDLRYKMFIPHYKYNNSQTSIKSTIDQFQAPRSDAFPAFFQPRRDKTQKDDIALTVSSSHTATTTATIADTMTHITTQPKTASNEKTRSSIRPSWISLIMSYRTRIADTATIPFVSKLQRRNEQEITLVDINWLKTHEEVIFDRVDKLKNAIKEWNEYRMPLLVDCKSGAILDGHHRYHVGRELGLNRLPVILVDYLEDDTIDVDVWPECGIDCLSKEDVIKMSLSDKVFPPKTSKHGFVSEINPISIPLSHLA